MGNPKIYNPTYQSQKKEFPKIYIYILLIVLLIVGIIYIIFYSSFFKIKNIIIQNTQNEEITQFLKKLNGENLVLFNADEFQQEMTYKFPEVKGAKITRGLPDTLKVEFAQKNTSVIWQTGSRAFLVDEKGFVYQEVDQNNDAFNKLPILKDNNNVQLEVGRQVVSENILNFVINYKTKFNQITGFEVARYEINDTLFQIDVITNQDWKLIIDTARGTDSQLTELKKFLDGHQSEVREYIDLRVEGRVYYK